MFQFFTSVNKALQNEQINTHLERNLREMTNFMRIPYYGAGIIYICMQLMIK